MATTSTTKAAFVKAVMPEMGNVRRLNKMSGNTRLEYVLNRIQRVREYDVVTHHQAMVAYAVVWSVQSLRLNHEPEQALRAMNTRQLVGLVYDLSKSCDTQIEVTYRLNEMYRPAPVVAQDEQEQSERLTPAQERVMEQMSAGSTLNVVEQAGKVVEAHLWNEQTGHSSVSMIVAKALVAKKRVCRYCWYESSDGLHVEYVAA